MTTTTKKRELPIRFYKLFAGSNFRIFAEPSRGIQKSTDQTVYKKVCEAWSEDVDNPDKCIILDRDDLVVPLTRGTNTGVS
jgi:hypothetical protein